MPSVLVFVRQKVKNKELKNKRKQARKNRQNRKEKKEGRITKTGKQPKNMTETKAITTLFIISEL